jgi:hypothetical protein
MPLDERLKSGRITPGCAVYQFRINHSGLASALARSSRPVGGRHVIRMTSQAGGRLIGGSENA